ncbi:MED7 [[Candida] subhashii]|uniref:Mediator of RNA polymerase II transcription subunit 7 n=1 Tax=[Candida] subhashii TaxID=561895 RepID=A0A8J5QGW5_9ASCO|nr:MED7 [[Candida] subhashii]KAG7661884.1 MED7 [[Candida] subhashii]
MSNDDIISSLYPPPPPYVKFFTNENLNQLDIWKNDQQQQQQQQSDITPPGVLRFLIPPKPPAGSHYRGYGNIWSFDDKLPSLKDSNWEQLYKDNDELITSETKIQELHKLMDSLLLNFLELIGIMSIDPQQFESKVKHISLILININHLLNTYRPHQSRESLIMLLRKQIDCKKLEIDTIDKVINDVKSKIFALTNDISDSNQIKSNSNQNLDNKQLQMNSIINKLLDNI